VSALGFAAIVAEEGVPGDNGFLLERGALWWETPIPLRWGSEPLAPAEMIDTIDATIPTDVPSDHAGMAHIVPAKTEKGVIGTVTDLRRNGDSIIMRGEIGQAWASRVESWYDEGGRVRYALSLGEQETGVHGAGEARRGRKGIGILFKRAKVLAVTLVLDHREMEIRRQREARDRRRSNLAARARRAEARDAQRPT